MPWNRYIISVLLPSIVLGCIAVSYTQLASAQAFEKPNYTFTVTGPGVVGTVTVTGTGEEMSRNYFVESVNGETNNLPFSVGDTSGVVTYNGGTGSITVSYTLSVSAAGPGVVATVEVVVRAVVPNQAPEFTLSSYGFTVSGSGTVGTVLATDADGDTVNYSLADAGTFSVGVTSGVVSYNGGTMSATVSYTLAVSATDASGASDSATVEVLVRATAVPNRAPEFTLSSYGFTVSGSGTVGTVLATDADGDTVNYSLADAGTFSVGVTSGVVSYNGGTMSATVSYTLAVSATDASGASDSATVEVLVRATAVPNRAPEFTLSSYGFTVSGSGTVGTVLATDADGDTVNYSLADAGTFSVGVTSGVVSYNGGTMSATVSYTLAVSATDASGASDSATVEVLVRATAVPNRAPEFTLSSYGFTVSGSGTVGTVLATDADGDTVNYSLADAGTFSVGVTSGVVSYNGGTMSATVSYTLAVSATDASGASDSATVEVLVRATAVPNRAPEFTLSSYGFTVSGSGTVGTVLATDADGDTVNYSLADAGTFSVGVTSGVVSYNGGTMSATVSYTLAVSATDASGASDSATVEVLVRATAVPNRAPEFTLSSYGFTVSGSGTVGTVLATDADGDTVNYSLADAGTFSVGVTSGVVSYNGGTMSATVSYTLAVSATDASGASDSATVEVLVRATAVPNRAPEFTLSSYGFTVSGSGTVGTVLATDADGDTVNYSLADAGTFSVGVTSGVVSYNGGTMSATVSYTLAVSATDASGASDSATVEVLVRATAVPNRAPEFTLSSYGFTVSGSGTVGTVLATDADGDTVNYSLADAGTFSVGVTSGVVSYNGGTMSATVSYTLAVSATDASGASDSATVEVLVRATAVPNRAPEFTLSSYGFTVSGSGTVGTVLATDADGDTVNYSLADAGTFSVGVTSGVVSYNGGTMSATVSYTLAVSATDASGASDSATVEVLVRATAVPNRAPEFTLSSYGFTVSGSGTVGTVLATDADGDTVNYSLADAGTFSVGVTSGVVSYNGGTMSATVSYTLAVSATDASGASDSATVEVLVRATAVPNRAPEFTLSSYGFTVSGSGTVGTVLATDADGDTVNYSLADAGTFSVGVTSGVVSYNGGTMSATVSYTLAVSATDASGASDSATVEVLVRATAVPNRAPEFTLSSYGFTVSGSGTVGTVLATDADGDTVNYSLADAGTFSVGVTSGVVSYNGGTMSATVSYTLAVSATDASGASDSATVEVLVRATAVPNRAPEFTLSSYGFTVSGSGTVGTVLATDADGDTVNYSLADAGTFSVGVTSGVVSYNGGTMSATVSYTLAVSATDASGASDSATVEVLVRATAVPNRAPEFTLSSYGFTVSGSGTVGTVLATDADGDAVNYSLADAGTFSVGVTSGVVSYNGGTMSATVSYTLAVSATDASGASDSATVEVLVRATAVPNRAPEFTLSSYGFTVSGSGTVGTVLATDADGDTVNYSLADAGTFSVGVTSGVVSYNGGTMSATVSYTLAVSATDASGASDSATVEVLVRATAVPNRAPEFTLSSYGFTVSGSGTVGTVLATDADGDTVNYSLADAGTFSVGVTSGVVSYNGGTMSATVSYTLAVSATDASGASDSATVEVLVRATAVPNRAPEFTLSSYGFTVSGSGTVGTVLATDADGDTVNYSLADAGTFSVGVTSGVVSYNGGTMSATVSYTLAVSATDASGASDSATVEVLVRATAVPNRAPEFTLSSYGFTVSGSGTVGTVLATDADGDTVNYSLADAGTFSVGVTSGVVSYNGGTMSATVSYTLAVSATDASGASDSATVEVLVRATAVPNRAPEFTLSSYGFTVSGSGTMGTVLATDADGDTVNYSLADAGTFSVGVTSGVVSYNGGTMSATVSYTLAVSATDASGASDSATVEVLVRATAVPNRAPSFEQASYGFTVSGSGTVGTVLATDADGDTVNYSLADAGTFSVGVTSGVVSYNGGTMSATVSYTLAVSATDASGASDSATVEVLVRATAVPNRAPEFTLSSYGFTVSGAAIAGTVTATDDGGSAALSYSLLSVNGGAASLNFSVATLNGEGVVTYSGGEEVSTTGYTLMVSASDTSEASASATVTVLVRPTAVIDSRTKKVAAVLADVGRSVAIDALDVLGARFDVGAHVIVSGNALNLARWANGEWAKQLTDPWTGQWKREWAQLSRWMDGEYWQRSSERWDGKEREASRDFGLSQRWDQLEAEWERQRDRVEAEWNQLRKGIVSGSSFLMPLGASDRDAPTGGLGGGWTVWGKGHASGYQRVSDGLKSKSQSLSGYLGVDYQATKELLLGVAVSRGKSDGYAEQAADGTGRIDVDTTMTSVWPYASWDSGAGARFWAALGHGTGTAEIDEQGVLRETDIAISAVMFGAKRRLLSAGSARISVKADGFVVEMESDAIVGYLKATNPDAHRLRVALSADNSWRLSKTTRGRAGIEFGIRRDGGDSAKGRGLDIGAQVGYSDAAMGLTMTSQARLLLAHSADYREWGLGTTVVLKPGLLGRGVSLKLIPRWGRATTDINRLWTDGIAALQRTNASGRGLVPDHTRLSLSYGVGYGGVVLRPYTSLVMQRDTMSEVTLGLKLNTRGMQLSLFGNQARAIGINGRLRW